MRDMKRDDKNSKSKCNEKISILLQPGHEPAFIRDHNEPIVNSDNKSCARVKLLVNWSFFLVRVVLVLLVVTGVKQSQRQH